MKPKFFFIKFVPVMIIAHFPIAWGPQAGAADGDILGHLNGGGHPHFPIAWGPQAGAADGTKSRDEAPGAINEKVMVSPRVCDSHKKIIELSAQVREQIKQIWKTKFDKWKGVGPERVSKELSALFYKKHEFILCVQSRGLEGPSLGIS